MLVGTTGIRETTGQSVTVLTSSDLLSMDSSRFVQWLVAARPAAVSAEDKARTLSTLPETGEIVNLNEGAHRKLASLGPLLRMAGRESIYEFKVIDLPQAVQPHPILLRFLVRLPSTEAKGRWRERGRTRR
jgi:hypothetical protein